MGGNQTWVENREMQLDQLLFIHNLLSLWENCAYGFWGICRNFNEICESISISIEVSDL